MELNRFFCCILFTLVLFYWTICDGMCVLQRLNILIYLHVICVHFVRIYRFSSVYELRLQWGGRGNGRVYNSVFEFIYIYMYVSRIGRAMCVSIVFILASVNYILKFCSTFVCACVCGTFFLFWLFIRLNSINSVQHITIWFLFTLCESSISSSSMLFSFLL